MPTSRGDYRYRVNLEGWLHAPPARNAAFRPPEPARVLDLSRSGARLQFDAPPPDGLRLGGRACLAIDDPTAGAVVIGRWLGRVAHAGPFAGGGHHVGLAFDGTGGGVALPVALAELSPVPGGDERTALGELTAWAATLAGLSLDQASKAWAGSLGDLAAEVAPGLFAVAPRANHGALASLAGDLPATPILCAAVALTVAGLAPGWGASGAPRRVAAGLLAAGLIGNAADRLALGYVRDFLVSPAAPHLAFNLADVFLVLGAGGLLASRRQSPNP